MLSLFVVSIISIIAVLDTDLPALSSASVHNAPKTIHTLGAKIAKASLVLTSYPLVWPPYTIILSVMVRTLNVVRVYRQILSSLGSRTIVTRLMKKLSPDRRDTLVTDFRAVTVVDFRRPKCCQRSVNVRTRTVWIFEKRNRVIVQPPWR